MSPPDSHALDQQRLDRAHVVNVRLRPSGVFIVACSDGTDVSWAEWCAWGCVALRQPIAPSPPSAAETGGA